MRALHGITMLSGALCAIALLGSTTAFGQSKKTVLVSAVDQQLLDMSLDPADSKIVLEHVLNAVVFRSIKHVHHTYKDEATLMAELDKKNIDLFVMFLSDYLEHTGKDMEPAFVLSKESGSPQESYLFLSNKKSGKLSLSDFKGQPLLIHSAGSRELLDAWLEVELHKIGEKVKPSEFFESITHVTKGSKAAIPVFFGKVPACVISRGTLDTLSVLNPQIGARLASVMTSPPFLQGLLVFRKSMSQAKKELASEGILRLNETPGGSQLLRFAKIQEIIPFREEYATETAALIAQHRAILAPKVLPALAVDVDEFEVLPAADIAETTDGD